MDYTVLEYINTLYSKYPNAKAQIQLFYDIVNDIKEIQYCEVCKKNQKRFYNMALNASLNWQEIITFVDLRWHFGDVYEKSGFSLDKTLLPDYEYVINGKRYHKFNFRHKGIKQKFPDKYDPLLTESENMEKIGVPKIYDCGKNRFIIKR